MTIDHRPSTIDHRPSTIDHLGHWATNKILSGFTLIEMMVVIGIIAILGAVIVPGFKKIYSDFRMMETYNMLDSILSSMRSFYLIRNEQTWTIYYSKIEERLFPFLSGEWLEVKNHFWGISNYGTHPKLYDTKYVKRFYKIPDSYNPWYSTDGHKFCFRFYYKNGEPPYYLDDLIERYRERGYKVYHNGYDMINIFFPERIDDADNIFNGRYFR